jgi:hypothetical protein
LSTKLIGINMADQIAHWANISDVDTLKAMLAAQLAQLAQLQTQTAAPVSAPAPGAKHSDRKRKAVKLHDDECSDFEDDDEWGLDQGLQADDDEYNPANDSDYEEPKKKKQVHNEAAVLLTLQLAGSIVCNNWSGTTLAMICMCTVYLPAEAWLWQYTLAHWRACTTALFATA